MILLAKFGVSSSFNMCYLGNATIFPTLFAGTAYGICNTFGKLATIVAPSLAEVKMPTPMIVFVIITSLAAGLALIIKVPPPVQNINQIESENDLSKTILPKDSNMLIEDTTMEESHMMMSPQKSQQEA
jgi:hypothetical protein